jgi:hypothetical protein
VNRALFVQTWRAQWVKVVLVCAALAIWGALMPTVYGAFGTQMRQFMDSGIVPKELFEFGGGNVLLAMVGPQVTPGQYDDLQSHYGLLRTLEDGFGIGTYANNAATADPITNIWP